MKKLLIFFSILIILSIFIILNIRKRVDNEFEKIGYETVKKRNIEISYECEGEIECYNVYEILPPMKSFVKRIFKYPGEEVKKGDTITILLNNELEYRFEKIKYEIEELKIKLNEINSLTLDKSYYKKELKDLNNELRMKEIEFEYIKKEYDKLNIVAPSNCYILRINSKEGELTDGIFIKFSKLDTLVLKTKFSSAELSGLRIGPRFKIKFYSHGNIETEGILFYINYEGEKIKENYEYFVGIKFRKIGNILPGSKANVKIFYDFENKLCVPNDAIVEKSEKNFVLLKNGEIREIKTGISGSQYTEILSGLEENDTIVSGPFEFILNKVYGR